MQQRRWVSYIYRYRDDTRCEIAGFIKVQRINHKNTEMTRIQMGMKMYKEYACTCYAYLLRHGQAAPLSVMEFAAGERDTILTRKELPWSDPLGNGVPFPEYDGIYFVCDDGEILAGIWTSERYDLRQVQVTEMQETAEAAESPAAQEAGSIWEEPVAGAADVQRQAEQVGKIPQIQIPREEADGYMEMLATYPKLPLFTGSQIVDGVKIAPQDIGRLDMANWKLGVNSFLAHGYYKYQYLMLGIIKMNKAEMRVIGVPGVFTNKERYLANMFGFRVFIPVRKTKILTGNFGYWVSEVVEHGDAEQLHSS